MEFAKPTAQQNTWLECLIPISGDFFGNHPCAWWFHRCPCHFHKKNQFYKSVNDKYSKIVGNQITTGWIRIPPTLPQLMITWGKCICLKDSTKWSSGVPLVWIIPYCRHSTWHHVMFQPSSQACTCQGLKKTSNRMAMCSAVIKYRLWTDSPEDKQASKQASNRRRNIITRKLVSSTYFCILQTSASQRQKTKARSNPGPKDHNRRTLARRVASQWYLGTSRTHHGGPPEIDG